MSDARRFALADVSWTKVAIAAAVGVVAAVGVFVVRHATAPAEQRPASAATSGRAIGSISVAQYRRIELRMSRARVLALLGPPAAPTPDLVEEAPKPSCWYYRPVDLPNNVGFRFCFARKGSAKGKVDSIAAY